jgi:hypothetical protein
MKRVVAILIFLSIFKLIKAENGFLPGYIITKSDRKVECKIQVNVSIDGTIDYYALRWIIKVEKEGYAAIKVKAEEIKGFVFNYEGKEYKFFSFENKFGWGRSNAFLKLEREGAINLYRFCEKIQLVGSAPMANFTATENVTLKSSTWFISKNKSSVIRLTDTSGLRDMIADNQELYNNVDNKSMDTNDLIAVVVLYNNWKIDHQEVPEVKLPDEDEKAPK